MGMRTIPTVVDLFAAQIMPEMIKTLKGHSITNDVAKRIVDETFFLAQAMEKKSNEILDKSNG